jgi:predicted amidophosphoribosyltransferase
VDATCAAWGCRISGEVPLDSCEDCGEPVARLRRLVICEVCILGYTGAPTTRTNEKG